MSTSQLMADFERLGHPRALVVGDLILDRYTFGNAERLSQEAPVIVLRADQREARLGGAANVCNMLRGLEAEVVCAGVIGADADGQQLRALLRETGADDALVIDDPARPTTAKERFIGRAQGRHPHQILRVDHEVRMPLATEIETRLASSIVERIGEFDVLLISDYDKGVCTATLLHTVIDAARAAGVPVVVDPVRSADYSRYRGATTMTPNRVEAEMATGVAIRESAEAVLAGERLRRDVELEFAVVTLDRDGMALVRGDGHGEIFPTCPRAVYDITGAGDIVLATIGFCLAEGWDPADALRLGNITGGLEVEKVGVAVVTRDEIRARLVAEQHGRTPKIVGLDELARLVDDHRARGQRIVFTNGCFDLLHVGHIGYLSEAAQLGDVLIVAVNSDGSVRRLKGDGRPVIGEGDRAAMLAALAAVDYVIVHDDDRPEELLARLRPDVLVKGGDYSLEEVVGGQFVASYGGQVCVTRRIADVSTTGILTAVGGTALPGPHYRVAPGSTPVAVPGGYVKKAG